MPVIECSPLESRAINAELLSGMLARRALEERAMRAPSALRGVPLPRVLAFCREKLCAADTTRKLSILSAVVCSRALSDGTRASFPPVLYWLRDPGELGAKQGDDLLADLCLLAWGDVWEEIGDGRVRLRMPYVPLGPWAAHDEPDWSKLRKLEALELARGVDV